MNNTNNKIKVLIVDDSPLIVERLKEILNEISVFEVVGDADNGNTADEIIMSERPDLLILDIHLKGNDWGSNGINLLSRTRPKNPEMSIIMLTNIALHEYIKKCTRLGANYFFDKTNEFDKLRDTLKILARTKIFKN